MGGTPSLQPLVEQVLACFDAYSRARAARDGLLSSSRTSPHQEQRAFEDLRRAIEGLRNAAP
ncbi:hypothetical protein K388_06792 [Streptomyces sp. KhCrAH-43]|uniref:hypothetical protein n=1 Tax=unclassified Streptomyces TaxID=2593676 RepID=UPI0003778A40|nr:MULTISPECIES: hypothetical protein [unclassified Streptomyces]MYS38991.1 hypothetical protein [Streptomyces sp. SID4920]MYX68471.1 hypothetical protein [Streptomyces sp. SID8373]RAJ49533.1 hypothetical protein K388_06792 [Streptomyces sp. KhCrAH-43]